MGGGYEKIKGLGFAVLEKYFRIFRIDKILGIDLPGEASGFVPSEEWKIEKFGQSWFTGDTYNVSIGQGDLLTTPLWLSSYVSAIANGGTFYRPFVVKKIMDQDKRVTEEFQSEQLGRLPFDETSFSLVREAIKISSFFSSTAACFTSSSFLRYLFSKTEYARISSFSASMC